MYLSHTVMSVLNGAISVLYAAAGWFFSPLTGTWEVGISAVDDYQSYQIEVFVIVLYNQRNLFHDCK